MGQENLYDLVIVGSGPAGLTASIYASRYALYSLIIGKEPGGRAMDAAEICNFPSQAKVSGVELMQKIQAQVRSSGAEIMNDEVVEIVKEESVFVVKREWGESVKARAVILATGLKDRSLGLSEEKNFLGRGVSYCFTCDGPFYQHKTVAVVGGADAANTASLFLSTVADKVFQIYRRDELRGTPAWKEKVLGSEKIEVVYNTNVVGLKGGKKLESIVLDQPYQGSKELNVDGLFVEIGATPVSILANDLGVKIDENGYIITGSDQSTNVNGVWAAGDITTGSDGFCQIVTACAEGAVAARAVYDFLR